MGASGNNPLTKQEQKHITDMKGKAGEYILTQIDYGWARWGDEAEVVCVYRDSGETVVDVAFGDGDFASMRLKFVELV